MEYSNKVIEDLWEEHSQHETPLPTRCSECWKEKQESDQLTEDKRRAEAEDCQRSDYEKYNNEE